MLLRFSLKTLLLGVGVLSVCFALMGWRFFLGITLSAVLLGSIIVFSCRKSPNKIYPLVGFLLILFGCLFSTIIWITGPPVPTYHLNRIDLGTPQEQVRYLLGEPESVSENGIWYYSHMGCGWVGIVFNENDTVIKIEDERAW